MEKDLHINSIDDLIKLAESERLGPTQFINLLDHINKHRFLFILLKTDYSSTKEIAPFLIEYKNRKQSYEFPIFADWQH
jgi:hypothetical protein